MLNHSGSVLQVPTILKISFLILLLVIQVQADAPINYNKELASDVELRGTFFTDDNADGFYVSLVGENSIQIDSDICYIDKTIKIKKTALDSRFKKFNGVNIRITHISNDGIVNNYISPVVVDGEFVYITVDFSTVIINGMTGTTTTTLTGLSGNQSISVPDGSSYDLNITNNQEGVWSAQSDIGGNYSNFKYKVPITLNHSGALSTYQLKINTTINDSIRFGYTNETYIPNWNETNGSVLIKNDYLDGNTTIWMYYGNDSLSSESNGNDTFSLFEDGSGSSLDSSKWTEYHDLTPQTPGTYTSFSGGVLTLNPDVVDVHSSSIVSVATDLPLNAIVTLRMYSADSGQYPYHAVSYGNGALSYISTHSHWGLNFYNSYSEQGYSNTLVKSIANTETDMDDATNGGWGSYNILDFKMENSEVRILKNEGAWLIGEGSNLLSGTQQLSISAGKGSNGGGNMYIDYVRVLKYAATKPTYYIGAPQQAQSATNITASVTGDSNEQSYNISQSREFTLTPTGTTNNVFINTTSTDYDITVTTYWTENTTLQTETAAAGYAKQYINYTPSFNITSADLNTTFTFDFSAQDYIGTATSTLDDVSKTTTRDGEYVNASVGSLTESTPYWWNVTVPYNNIFTLSEQSDITAFLGVSKQFSDSTYHDPEGLLIDSRLWNFGDGGDSSSSNPNHTYVTIGNFNANYSVTETATVSPQTIVREFNVSVEVQPPQNVTTVPHQTNVSINWDDYAYADKYSVYELEDGFPYVDTNPTVDGVKDAIYDYAHEFLIFSPNPVNPGDYETSYPVRTALGAYFFHEAVDNDDKLGDDDLIYYFDLDNDGLTVDDPAWKITNNIVKKYLWNGGSWQVTGVSDAVGASTGGSTHYPKHELFIPIAELGANWTNGSTVKVLVKREDSALSPDVITWYPFGNINDTDTALWQEMVLNDPNTYTWLVNVTLSNYTALNLTPFTIYHGAVSAWNGTDESDYSLFDVITEDLPIYSASGYISDIDGDPIADATVYSCNGFVHEITTTNVSGYWVGYNFREDYYTICANKAGYYGNSIDIFVDSNLTNQNITLTAEPVVIVSKYQKIGEMLFAIPTILKLVFQKIVDVIPIFVVLVFIMLIINVIGVAIHAIRGWR